MPENVPIACTLTGEQLSERLAEITAVGGASLLAVDDTPGGCELRFRANPRTRQRLEAIMRGESECCAFLDLDLREDGDELALTITGPELARPAVDELVEAFSAAR